MGGVVQWFRQRMMGSGPVGAEADGRGDGHGLSRITVEPESDSLEKSLQAHTHRKAKTCHDITLADMSFCRLNDNFSLGKTL